MKFISREIFFSVATQLWRFVYGPVILLFIPLFLTAEHQGFWFTFISISALSVFADLGFSSIVTQFSSHEAAFADFKGGRIAGDPRHIERLSSLFLYVKKWTIRVSLFSFPVIFIVGYIIFAQKGPERFWLTPWIIYLVGSAMMFIINSAFAFFEGCHMLATVQKVRLYSSILYSGTLLLFLWLDLGLYALAFAMIANAALNFLFAIRYFGKYIRILNSMKHTAVHLWRHEILQLLWKYAISWSSGYFFYQLFTPLMFHFHGPVAAGKVGLTMSLWTTIYNLSTVWIYVSIPKLNMHAAKRNWAEMDRSFSRNYMLSAGTYLLGMAALAIGFFVISGRFAFIDGIIDRFLPIIPILFISAGWLLQILINSITVYLRAHKQEPLLYLSVATAVFISVTTLAAAKYLPADYFFIGFTSSFLWTIPAALYTFKKKKAQWH